MPDHPLPPDHAARRRPTPYPEPRVGQVWKDPDGVEWDVVRVFRRGVGQEAGTVTLERALPYGTTVQKLKRGVDLRYHWDRVKDDR